MKLRTGIRGTPHACPIEQIRGSEALGTLRRKLVPMMHWTYVIRQFVSASPRWQIQSKKVRIVLFRTSTMGLIIKTARCLREGQLSEP